MPKLLFELQQKFPALRFVAGPQFSWSPETGDIIYDQTARGSKAAWSLLHETGHALLGHTGYSADLELLRLEIAAWEKALEIGESLGVKISEEHIQDCLDTYRDWLYKRSICPNCSAKSLQQDNCTHYSCFNCHTVWRVSASRFCRAYRRSKDVPKQNVFHLT
jgi:hypothetical protein